VAWRPPGLGGAREELTPGSAAGEKPDVSERFVAVVVAVVGLAACGHKDDPGAAASASSLPSAAPSAIVGATPSASTSAPAPSASVDAASPPADDLRRGTVVVNIGDSFTEASFEQNLRARMKGVGAKYVVKAQTPSYTPARAFGGYGGTLDTLLDMRPKLVIVTLGANELDMPDPNLHAAAVRELARKASKWGQCVWVTPPRWKPDTGFLEVIKNNCAPCAFFDSDLYVHDVERQKDKIHPNEVGGARWAAAFWDWLEANRDPSKGAWALKSP
jgi:lysophospholipase L1-like esterase